MPITAASIGRGFLQTSAGKILSAAASPTVYTFMCSDVGGTGTGWYLESPDAAPGFFFFPLPFLDEPGPDEGYTATESDTVKTPASTKPD